MTCSFQKEVFVETRYPLLYPVERKWISKKNASQDELTGVNNHALKRLKKGKPIILSGDNA